MANGKDLCGRSSTDHEIAIAPGGATVNPHPSMNRYERDGLCAPTFWAQRVYPGPVGELISRELLAWEQFGYRLGSKTMIMRLVEDVTDAPVGQTDAA
jgi:hypothetical protein